MKPYGRNKIDIAALVQSVLEYFERHGGLYAFVTIKKLLPRYESVMFSWNVWNKLITFLFLNISEIRLSSLNK